MKRVNRAYEVLSDPEKRLNYDTISGGRIDLRAGGLARPHPVARKRSPEEVDEFASLSIFRTRGPLKAGPRISGGLGVPTALAGILTASGLLLAPGPPGKP